MPVTYRRTATDSDLGGGADFNKAILLPESDTTGPQTVTLGNQETRTSRAFTAAGVPGSDGVTGTYTVEMNVMTGNTNVALAVRLHRINSAGTVQASSALSAEQNATAGVKTFTFSSQSLGTWAAGDRLRVDYQYRNLAHGGQSFDAAHGGVNNEVVAPWAAAAPAYSGGSATSVNVTTAGAGDKAASGGSDAAAAVTTTGGGEGPSGSSDGYVLMDAVGEFVSTPDHNDLDFGELDIRWLVEFADWTPATTTPIVEKWATTNNQRSFVIQLLNTGRYQLLWSPNGATPVQSQNSQILGYADGTRKWGRVTFDPSTFVVAFYESDDGSSWTDRGGGTGTGSIFAGTASLILGNDDGPSPIKFYAADFLSSVGGAVVADPDFRDADQTSDGGLTFIDSTAKTWTLQGGAIWVEPTGGTPEGGSDAVVDVTTVGVGVKAASGGSAVTVAASTTGAGTRGADGGADATVAVSATGAGEKSSTGGSDAAVTVSATGAGTKVGAGGSDAAVTIAVTGGGFATVAESGGSDAAVTVTTQGDGTKAASGGSDVAVSVAVTGGGQAAAEGEGGSATQVNVTAAGDGQKHASGGSDAVTATTSSGDGDKATSGGSDATIVVAVTGGGSAAEVRSGGSSVSVTTTVAGDGTKDSLGGADAITATVTEGSGVKSGQGGANVTVEVSATGGDGTRTSSGGSDSVVAVTVTGDGRAGEFSWWEPDPVGYELDPIGWVPDAVAWTPKQ